MMRIGRLYPLFCQVGETLNLRSRCLRWYLEKPGFTLVLFQRINVISMNALRRYKEKFRHIYAHFETKFIPYEKGVIAISQNRIERYHAEIRPKEVKMRGVSKL